MIHTAWNVLYSFNSVIVLRSKVGLLRGSSFAHYGSVGLILIYYDEQTMTGSLPCLFRRQDNDDFETLTAYAIINRSLFSRLL